VELDRSGKPIDARITSASAHKLLDLQALRDVRSARYAAFPAEVYTGEESHRFLMTIEYSPAAQ
jgi:TonB family protein